MTTATQILSALVAGPFSAPSYADDTRVSPEDKCCRAPWNVVAHATYDESDPEPTVLCK